jgi:hypothetical protein
MATVELPENVEALAFVIADRLRASHVAGEHLGPFEVRQVLQELAALQQGPRYVAEPNRIYDSGGNSGYVVRDTRTGRVESTYEGYFAGQDAHSYARILNGEEE